MSSLIPYLRACIMAVFVYLILRFTHKQKRKSSVQSLSAIGVAGVPSSKFFPWARGATRAIFKFSENVAEGYQSFCINHGQPFALPSTSVPVMVALPPSMLHVLDMPPRNIVSVGPVEAVQPKYMIGNASVYAPPLHLDAPRRLISRDRVGALVPAMASEVDTALRQCWGVDPAHGWMSVKLWDSFAYIAARVACRTFIGPNPISGDDTLLRHAAAYSLAVFRGSAVMAAIPIILRPMIGPLIGRTSKKPLAAWTRIVVPFVEKRLRLWSEEGSSQCPDDALQGIIEKNAKIRPGPVDAVLLAHSLLQPIAMAIYANVYTMVNFVSDLHSSTSKDEIIALLREECQNVADECPESILTKSAMDKCHSLDSALRESMRMSSTSIVANPREVAPGNGLDLDGGIHIPSGIRLCVPVEAIHRDPRFYRDPLTFDAFRFSNPSTGQGEGVSSRQEAKRIPSTASDETFLAWGWGKHTCPGRWYSTLLIKFVLANMILHYDLEVSTPWVKRPLLNMVLPPVHAEVRVKRKLVAN